MRSVWVMDLKMEDREAVRVKVSGVSCMVYPFQGQDQKRR